MPSIWRNNCCWRSRPLVIIHDLSHCRCHAACSAVFVSCSTSKIIGVTTAIIFIIGTQIVVRRILIPMRLYQRGNGFLDGWRCAVGSLWRCGLIVVLVQPSNLVGITLQPCTHVARHVVRVEGTRLAIAQNGRCAVVVRHDDIALVLFCVKHIESADASRHLQLGNLSLTPLHARWRLLQEFLSLLQRLLGRHVACRHDDSHHNRQKK